jgi:aspartyl-tRNA(Asn)/glutamyl-tRNA(Gln) amidotransferase subunit A
MDLCNLALEDAAAGIAHGEIRPSELAQACLDRIEKLQPRLNAFITVTGKAALAAAGRVEKELASDRRFAPLAGIPLAVKDMFETAGILTTAGTTFWADYIPASTARVVRRLERRGMGLIGKTNLHEIALGITNINPHFGAARNPWDPQCISGGSSGGSAVAVAAGMAPAGLGTDTGGSIRIPAALCGITGFKPTFGALSRSGLFPLSWSLDHVGPLAHTAAGARLLFRAMAGYDPDDPYSQRPRKGRRPADGMAGARVALAVGDYIAEKSEPLVLRRAYEAAEVLASLGAQLERVELPELERMARFNGQLAAAEAAAFHRDRLAANPHGFGPDVLERLQGGAALSSTELALARRGQVVLRRRMEQFFERFDLLLLPTVAVPALAVEGTDSAAQRNLLLRFTAPFNLTGLPALSVPCGFTDAGLPVGLQMVGGPWMDEWVLEAGMAYRRETNWHTYRPKPDGQPGVWME